MSLASDKIQRASTRMLLSYPWWSTLYLHLRVQESTTVPTMATDGTWLLYNPQFTEALPDNEVLTVLMHETAHCALLHSFRRGHRNPLLWNIACDMAVNALLAADNLFVPKGCVPAGPLGKTAEQMYDELLDDTKMGLPRDLFDSGTFGEPGGLGEPGMSERAWKDALASNRGLEPDALSRIVQSNAEAKVDWRNILAQFIHSTRKSNWHTWNRPSRRLKGMPGWEREPESTIAICIDTSGSIGDTLLSVFLSELGAIVALSGVRAYLISADAAVHQIIEPGDEMPKAWTGGGGTDFRPGITKSLELEANAIVYFTDGDGTFPQNCSLPVLWALTQDVPVTFGTAIRIGE